MTEVRPVLLETPQKQQAFIDPKTGALTTYGHHVMRALFERTGGFDDDVWKSLGIGFTNLSQQANSVRRLEDLETATAGITAAIGGLRGDPRLATAERAEGLADDAMFVGLSRAPADVVRRVEEIERAVAFVATSINEIRAGQRRATEAIQSLIDGQVIQQTYERQFAGATAKQVNDRIDLADAQFNEKVDDRVSGLVQNGTGLSWAYDDAAGTFTGTVSLAAFNTGSLTEGSNLYYTNARADGRIAAAVGVSVQAYSAILDEYAAVNPTAAGLALLDDADAAAQRDTLGLATRTGWTAATGTATRTTFDTATVTLPQLAERVKALLDDLTTSDLIGA